MKKLLFALLLCAGFALPALAQSGNPPITITEVDGSPRVTNPTKIVVSNGSLTVSGKTATIVTGGGGGGGTPGGANTQVQYNNAGSFGGVAGFTFNGTSTISLGVAGTSVGAIGFRNATSGTITLQPVTGALGTVTLSLPAATDTLVGRATTDTLSNKTLASPSVTGTIGAEATSLLFFGSNYYRYVNTTGPAFYDVTTDKILTFNVQSLTDNRTVTWPDAALTVAGVNVANAWADGIKQTFNPDATTAGFNVGSVAGDPSVPANGDIWYDSTANELTARINGANVALGAGSGGITVGTTTVTSGTATRLFYETAGNVVGQVSGVTSDGTNVTAGSGNLRATSPRITTGINDANGNVMLAFSPAGSATEYITIANNTATNAVSLTASSPTVAASAQAGTPLNLTASPAIAGNVNVGAAAGGSVTITAGAAARLTSGNADGGNVFIVPGAGIGTGVAGGLVFGSTAASTSNRLRGTTSNETFLEQANGAAGNPKFFTQAIYLTQSVTDTGVNVALEAAGSSGFTLGSGTPFGFSSSSSAAGATLRANRDTFIRRNAAANLAFGAADAASPVAQTLSVQNVVGGTSNTAGANWTFAGSRGTGTGVGGDIIFQTAPAGGSGTSQNALAAAFTVKGDGAVQLKSVTFANLPTVANGYLIYCSDCTAGSSPCTSGGSGALAVGQNSAWKCF